MGGGGSDGRPLSFFPEEKMFGDKLVNRMVDYINVTRLPYSPLQCLDTVVHHLTKSKKDWDDWQLSQATVKHLRNATTRKMFEEIIICMDPIGISYTYATIRGKCKYPVFTLRMENGHTFHLKMLPGEPIKADYVTLFRPPPHFDEEDFPPTYEMDEYEPVLL